MKVLTAIPTDINKKYILFASSSPSEIFYVNSVDCVWITFTDFNVLTDCPQASHLE